MALSSTAHDHAPVLLVSPCLRLNLLGAWHAQRAGEPLPPLPTRHARVLLARLALAHPRSLSRAALQADVFPDMPPDRAARSFRTTLYYVRRALGNLVQTTGEQAGIDPAATVWTDVAQFEALSRPNATQTQLEQAVAYYGGPFLSGMADGWAGSEAQRLHAQYMSVLQRLVTIAQAAGTPETAIDAARRWVAEEPWHETAHVALLEALLHGGDRDLAEAHVRQARVQLRAEGSELSPAFEDVARRISRLARIATPTIHAATSASASPRSIDVHAFDMLPLIGRDALLQQIMSGWQEVRRGAVRCWIVEGVAGVGKSRLVQEVAARARLHANSVALWGVADAYTANRSFGLLRDAIARAPSSTHQRLRQSCDTLPDLTWAVLQQHIPEVRQFTDRAACELPSLDTHAEQARQQAAALAFVKALTNDGPLVLVLDNAHQADAETITLVKMLLDEARQLLVLMMRRPMPIPEDLAIPSAATVALQPLDEAATEHMLHALFDGRLASEFQQQIREQSGGNPLFVREIVWALVKHDVLVYDPAHGWGLRDGDLQLPQYVADLLRDRLLALSSESRELALLLAAYGQPADEMLLERFMSADGPRLRAQAELLEQSVLVERAGRLRFYHDWLLEILLSDVDGPSQRALHARVAAALPSSEAVVRMWHHAAAANWAQALDDSLIAAEQARQHGHLVPHQRALEVAAQAAEQLPLAHDDPRRWLLFTLQESYHAVIDRDAAWRGDLNAMLALAEASGRSDWLTEALNRRGRAQRELGQVADAEGMLRRAIAVACAAGLHHAEAAARINLSSVLDDGGAVADALAESVAAVSAAEAAGDTSLRARAEFVQAYMLMRNGRVAAADALMTALRDSDTVRQNPVLAGRAARQLGIIKLASGAYTDAFALMREAVRRTHEVGDLHGIVISQTSLFYELVNFGLYDEARQLGEVTVALARRLQAQVQLGALLSSQAALHLHTGEPHEALPLARECVQIAEAHGLTEYVAASLQLVADVELALGHLPAAQAAITRAVALMADITHPSVNVAPTAARVWLALGHVARAKQAACEAVQRCVTEGLGSNSAVDDLWWAAEVLREAGEQRQAHMILLQAYARFINSIAALDEPAMRRAFLAKTAAHRALAAATVNTPRRLVHLPHRDAPTGRPLCPEEFVPVVWTVQTDGDTAAPVVQRHAQIQRMAAEALAQHAVATVEQLAATLVVSARTIKRDLHLLRQAGVVVVTRGSGTRQ